MKQKRLYSLFEQVDGRWQRISPSAYTLSTAQRVFQDELLAYAFGTATHEKSLRVVSKPPLMVVVPQEIEDLA
jgi:hypothetical protein